MPIFGDLVAHYLSTFSVLYAFFFYEKFMPSFVIPRLTQKEICIILKKRSMLTQTLTTFFFSIMRSLLSLDSEMRKHKISGDAENIGFFRSTQYSWVAPHHRLGAH